MDWRKESGKYPLRGMEIFVLFTANDQRDRTAIVKVVSCVEDIVAGDSLNMVMAAREEREG